MVKGETMYEMNDIAEAVGRQPFQPIALQLSSGETIEITHPDGLVFTDYSILLFSGQGKT
jgi:hypothetical protein